MKGFKSFHSVNATILGIKLHHMLRKRPHQKSQLHTIYEQFMVLAA